RIIEFYGIHEQFDYVAQKYNENAFAAITIAGFTPIPFKVFTIAAGVFDINLFVLLFASILSRGARFFLLAALIYRFGPTIKVFIDKYFNLLAVAFMLLLGLGMAVVKYVI
ncbi:MAG: DedA family protein, partial [Candidatus Marinimicrobia bacterium]|nr:DedA family protein [Candidatus Neomarinimicrobiota bacterium]